MASAHERKVAERFAARGVGEADLPYAQTAYLGASESNCTLCDHPILHQFLLTFARPSGAAVEFFPVGSNCITTWVKAMPESVERSEALRRVRAAESEMRRQRKVLKGLDKAGDDDGANLMRLYYRLPADRRHGASDDDPLSDIGYKVERYGSFASDGQRRFFARLVRGAAREAGIDDRSQAGSDSGRQPAQPAPESFTIEGDRDGTRLIQRYDALSDDARQAIERSEALNDIAAKVRRFGSFASDGQRRFFAVLVREAERASGGSTPPPPPASTVAQPTVQGDLFADGGEPVRARRQPEPETFDDDDDLDDDPF